MSFDRLSIEHGLSQSTVNAILQDSQGFMWFGTQDGLNRYDGYGFTVYRFSPNDSASLSDSWISSLCEDDQGNIWIGTYHGGLNLYDRRRNSFTRFMHDPTNPASISGNNVSSVCRDSEGNIWAGVWGGGLNRFDKTARAFVSFRSSQADTKSLSSDNVRALYEDSDRGLWVGTWDGLNRFDPSSKQFMRFGNNGGSVRSGGGLRITSISEVSPGLLVLGTWTNEAKEHGLKLFDKSTGRFFSPFANPVERTASSSIAPVTSVLTDSGGQVWFGTVKGGLGYFDARTYSLKTYVHEPLNSRSLGDNDVFSLFRDRSGSFWVGTGGAGIQLYNPYKHRFRNYSHTPNDANSISHNAVRALCEDSKASLWIGTDAGLNRFDDESGKFSRYLHTPHDVASISHNTVRAIHEDRNKNVWIGTSLGLERYDRRRNAFVRQGHYFRESGMREVMAIADDTLGNIWIGTDGLGLFRFEPATKNVVRYKSVRDDSASLSGDYVWSLLVDTENTLWVGTWGGGLCRLDRSTNTFVRYVRRRNSPQEISNNTILAIYDDNEGSLWVGTSGGGLNRYDRESGAFSTFSEVDGLPNNTIYGIQKDEDGNIWLSTNRGLSRFNPETKSIRNYDIHDGLQSNEFNHGAHLQRKDGRIVFGGVKGLTTFHPRTIRDNPVVPPVVLTSFKILERPVPFGSIPGVATEITLLYPENVFSFEFAALEYTAPEKNRYAYKLEGFDKDWVYSGNRRYASYTHLDGGEYILRIKGSNSDGVWNDQGLSVKVVVTPPVWETWWFRLAAGVCIGAIVLIGLNRRMRELEKEKRAREETSRRLVESQEHERKRIAAGLHDSLGQNLLILKNALQQTMSEHGPGSGLHIELSSLTDLTQQLLDEVREIAFDLHPHVLDRLGLKKAIETAVDKMTQGSSTAIATMFNGVPDDLPDDVKIGFYRIAQEALSNISKHSGATSATLAVKATDGMLCLEVVDNGKGFDVNSYLARPPEQWSLGLLNIAERVYLLRGTYSISSAPGSGTTLTVSVPCKGDAHARS